jgi:hypothetical protein
MTIFHDDEWLLEKVTDGCDEIKEEDIVEWLVRQNKIRTFENWLAYVERNTFTETLGQMNRYGEEFYLKMRQYEYRRECAKELVAAIYPNLWPRFFSSAGIATGDFSGPDVPYGD